MKSPLTFVLVHGGWCWRRVADLLRKDGHLVFTPTLTGFGERVHLTRPDLTLEDFATDLVNVITAEELSDIILVGHSFGGNPVSVVGDRVPELLKQLVYLDTLLLKNGESGFSQLDSAIVAQRIELAEKTSGGLTIPPPSPEVLCGRPSRCRMVKATIDSATAQLLSGADPAGTSSGKWSQQDLHCLHEPGLPAGRSNT